ncbi:curli-like amyloid fiber formation chaperone CsgH [Pontibacter ummariensis]|nr:curli-like amyloid fiber formation chaperone CsgH [Pontibacter ummariensis]
MMILSGQTSGVPLNAGLYEAHIKAELDGRTLRIKNVFENNSSKPVDFRYKFKLERTGKSGSAISSQSGTLRAAPGEEVNLSATRVSIHVGDTCTLVLHVYDGSTPIAHDTVTVPAN